MGSPEESSRTSDLLFVVPAALAAALVVRLGLVFAARLPYPYDLEWMEGGMLAHAWRLQHGLPLYTKPSAEWIPFIYPPGYSAVLAAAGSVFGLGAPLGRVVSLAGTALATGSIAAIVARHGGSLVVGLLAAACWLGTYPDGGAFFDLVRTEALGTGLLLCAAALALDGRRGMAEAGGLVLACAFLTKQNLAAFGLPLLVAITRRDGAAAGARFVATSAGPALLITGVLQWRTEGRFLMYLLDVPASHPLVFPRAFPATPWELGRALPALGAGAVVAAGVLGKRPLVVAVPALVAGLVLLERGGLGPLGLPHVAGVGSMGPLTSFVAMAFLAGGAAAAAARRLDARVVVVVGVLAALALALAVGGPEGLSPVSGPAAFSVVGAIASVGIAAAVVSGFSPATGGVVGLAAVSIGVAMVMRAHLGGFVNVHLPMFALICVAGGLALARSRSVTPWLPAVVFTAQLAWAHARLSPEELVPSAQDRATGDAVVEVLRGVEGPVLSPYAPWLPVLAGKEPSWHLISLWDTAEHKTGPFPGTGQVIDRALKAHRWGAVADAQKTMGYGVRGAYTRSLPLTGDGFVPKTGWRTRPAVLRTAPETAPGR